jgi:hypothetical protein
MIPLRKTRYSKVSPKYTQDYTVAVRCTNPECRWINFIKDVHYEGDGPSASLLGTTKVCSMCEKEFRNVNIEPNLAIIQCTISDNEHVDCYSSEPYYYQVEDNEPILCTRCFISVEDIKFSTKHPNPPIGWKYTETFKGVGIEPDGEVIHTPKGDITAEDNFEEWFNTLLNSLYEWADTIYPIENKTYKSVIEGDV